MMAEPSVSALLQLLRSDKLKLVVAESLTGGMISAALSRPPGASEVFLGGIVAYSTQLKSGLVGVSRALLENQGAVDPEVAMQLAEGARNQMLRAGAVTDIREVIGLAATGVAGPTKQFSRPVGEVFIAISSSVRGSEAGSKVFAHHFEGSRDEIREATVVASIGHLWEEFHQSAGSSESRN